MIYQSSKALKKSMIKMNLASFWELMIKTATMVYQVMNLVPVTYQKTKNLKEWCYLHLSFLITARSNLQPWRRKSFNGWKLKVLSMFHLKRKWQYTLKNERNQWHRSSKLVVDKFLLLRKMTHLLILTLHLFDQVTLSGKGESNLREKYQELFH